jgi:hypothetical protein
LRETVAGARVAPTPAPDEPALGLVVVAPTPVVEVVEPAGAPAVPLLPAVVEPFGMLAVPPPVTVPVVPRARGLVVVPVTVPVPVAVPVPVPGFASSALAGRPEKATIPRAAAAIQSEVFMSVLLAMWRATSPSGRFDADPRRR